ncbi:MAG TPA: hypothetical protein VF432_19220 [Thermoanaerobaculia bacterium]
MRWRIAVGVLFVGTVVLTSVLMKMNRDDRAETGFAFPDLQNAETVVLAGNEVTAEKRAAEVLSAWQPLDEKDLRQEHVRNSMKVDLVFPFFYALLIALVCWRASLNAPTRWVAVAGRIAAAAAVTGGIFDVLENLKMLSMLGDPKNAAGIATVVLFRNLKVMGSMVGLVYALLAHFALPVKTPASVSPIPSP